MKIIVCGGDGFCGWPLSLRLSMRNHEVLILDNFNRRKIDNELAINSLTKIFSLSKRIEFWNKNINKKKIRFTNIHLFKDIKRLEDVIKFFKPDAIVMLAELKSAPYSLINLEKGNKTINNNLVSNHNILHLISKINKNIHFVHLGTMGVYGYDYSHKLIPDGYYSAELKNHIGETFKTKILHPASPGSIYHLTKAQEEIMFQYFNKLYGLKITDLHQGIVWGVNTKETMYDPILANRFDYDGIYGTALNRFIVQAACNHKITLHGSGNQIRPLININNSVDSIILSIENSEKKFKKVRVFNQLTETKKIKDLGNFVSKLTGAKIGNYKNPRIENEKNKLIAKPIGLKKLGLKPIRITEKKILELYELAKKNKKRIIKKNIIAKVSWKFNK